MTVPGDQLTAAPPARRAGPYRRLFAWVMARAGSAHDDLVAAHKRALFADVQGAVLEIGPGAGPNLVYYPPGITWIGVEPNPYMHAYLEKEAARLGRRIDVRHGTAEHLPLPDASVDVVVSTIVLCSVDQLSLSLQEILRVLRPGGRFLFVEHVAAPRGTPLRRLQGAVRPVWRLAADGCHPDRETWVAIERAGFSEVTCRHFRVPVPVVSPHIAGSATR